MVTRGLLGVNSEIVGALIQIVVVEFTGWLREILRLFSSASSL